MTLDEAIGHCEERSAGESPCALDHQQLAKWLKELMDFRYHEDLTMDLFPERYPNWVRTRDRYEKP